MTPSTNALVVSPASVDYCHNNLHMANGKNKASNCIRLHTVHFFKINGLNRSLAFFSAGFFQKYNILAQKMNNISFKKCLGLKIQAWKSFGSEKLIGKVMDNFCLFYLLFKKTDITFSW